MMNNVKYLIFVFLVSGCFSLFPRKKQDKLEKFLEKNPELVKKDSAELKVFFAMPETHFSEEFNFDSIGSFKIWQKNNITIKRYYNSTTKKEKIEVFQPQIDTVLSVKYVKYDFTSYREYLESRDKKRFMYLIASAGTFCLLIFLLIYFLMRRKSNNIYLSSKIQ